MNLSSLTQITTAKIVDLAVTTAKIATGAITEALINDDVTINNKVVPPGAIMAFATTSAPAGWIYCNGANNLSRTTYAGLYAVVLDSFGSGSSTSTFAIPDLRGVFVRGDGSQTITDLRSVSRTYSATFADTSSDSIQKIQGSAELGTDSWGCPVTSGAGVFKDSKGAYGSGVLQPAFGSGRYENSLVFDSSDSVSSGTETKPANVVLRYFIKF